jgi:hypothetical protein
MNKQRLRKFVQSLETNDVLHAHQGWRERSQTSEVAEENRRRKEQRGVSRESQ